jgi:hypothetical protein
MNTSLKLDVVNAPKLTQLKRVCQSKSTLKFSVSGCGHGKRNPVSREPAGFQSRRGGGFIAVDMNNAPIPARRCEIASALTCLIASRMPE